MDESDLVVEVHVGNLRVMVTNDDGSWFAQALEIDYAAEGETLDEMKARFEQGLHQTIGEHLRVFGGLEHLLQPAPVDAWRDFYAGACDRYRFSRVFAHTDVPTFVLDHFPFKGIDYFKPARLSA